MPINPHWGQKVWEKRLLYTLILLLILVTAPIIPLLRGYQQRAKSTVYGIPPSYEGSDQPLLGVNIDLLRYTEDAALDAALDKIIAAHIHWLRLRFPWYAVETSPDRYQWTPYDRIVTAARSRGLSIIALLDGTPSWLRPPAEADNPVVPPGDFNAYARFVGIFAHHYAGEIAVYQVWDQPNVTPFWGNRRVDAAGYVQLLKLAARAIHAANPAAIVLSAGLAPTKLYTTTAHDDVRYLQEMYAAGAAGSFDVLGAKAYQIDHDPGGLNLSRLSRLHQVMVTQGEGDKAIWAVGWGCHATPPGWSGRPSIWPTRTEAAQANCALAGLQRKWTQWPWLGLLTWDQFQPAIPADDPLWGFALLRPDGTPRPVYTALQQASATPTIGIGHHPADSFFWHGNEADIVIWGEEIAARTSQPIHLHWQDAAGHSGEIDIPANDSVLLWRQSLAVGKHFHLVADPTPPELLVYRQISHWPLQAARALAGVACLLLFLLAGLFWRHPTWHREINAAVAVIAAIFFHFAPGSDWALLPFLLLLLTTLYDFDLSLLLFAFSIPFAWQVQPLFGLLISPLELFWGLALLSGAGRFFYFLGGETGWRPRHWPALAWAWLHPAGAIDWAMLTLLLSGILATAMALRRDIAPHQFKITVMEPVLFYWLLRSSYRWPGGERRWLQRHWWLTHAMLLSGTVVVLIGLYQYQIHPAAFFTEGVFRMRSVYGSPNNLGLFLGRLLPLAIALWVAPIPRRNGLWPTLSYGIMALLIGLGIVLSASRGALLLGIPLALLFVAYFAGEKARRPVVAILIADLLSMVFFIGTSRASGSTLTRRLYVWRAAVKMLRDHPLGIGPDNFLYLFSGPYLPYANFPEPNLSHPHNILLHFWLALGVPGLLVFGWLLWGLYRTGRKLLRQGRETPEYWLALGLLAALADFLGHGLVDDAYFLPDLAAQFALIVALLTILAEQDKRQVSDSPREPPL